MKIEEAKEVIRRIAALGESGRRELAVIRRGVMSANDIETFAVLGRYVYPYSQTVMDAVSAVLAGFVHDGCVSGKTPYVTVLTELEKGNSDTRRTSRLLACESSEEAAEVLRHTMRYVISRDHRPIDYARLLADVVNFDIAGDAVRRRWAMDSARAWYKKVSEEDGE
ncbi:MAG: type I-E CRISPR-associated protein Cse2/CasB [Sutterella sp.]